MPKIAPFQKYAERYEKWFSNNPWVYEAELKAVRSVLPKGKIGVEIGVGSGRFAAPLGVSVGVDPSGRMREIAQGRGIQVLGGVAEKLPFKACSFDFILMVTTICFVDDVHATFFEAQRVLRTEGYLIVAFVDRDSPVGRKYIQQKNNNAFYKDAVFYSTKELVETMKQTGFCTFDFRQTIFQDVRKIDSNEPVKPGYGKGSFVVIRSQKREE